MPAKATKTAISASRSHPIVRAIHVTLDNKPGALAFVTRALANANINIEALESEILGRSAFFRFYTTMPAEAEAVIRKLGLITMHMDVLQVVLPNKPGEFARMCELLATNKINIESAFGSSRGAEPDAYYLRVDKPLDAQRILEAAQISTHRTGK